jgi:hypothetical protein
MNPQINVIALGVNDINRAKEFYRDSLGCPIAQEQGQYISFDLGERSAALALYPRAALAGDAGVAVDSNGFSGVTLNYLVSSDEQVDAVMAQAERGGATVTKPAQKAQWGGYFGYFSDPDGYLWKVASAG